MAFITGKTMGNEVQHVEVIKFHNKHELLQNIIFPNLITSGKWDTLGVTDRQTDGKTELAQK